jgi:hypothetical protein
VPTLAFLSQWPPPTPEQSCEVFATLGQLTSDVTLDRFGWSYVAHDRVFSFVPRIYAAAGPGGNPLLFVDESYDEPTATHFMRGCYWTFHAFWAADRGTAETYPDDREYQGRLALA